MEECIEHIAKLVSLLPEHQGVVYNKHPVTEINFLIYKIYHLYEHCKQGEKFIGALLRFKIADLAEIFRVKGSQKQAIVSCNGSEK